MKANQDKYFRAKELKALAKESITKAIEAKRGDYAALVNMRNARHAEFAEQNKRLEKLEAEHMRSLQETMTKENQVNGAMNALRASFQRTI